MKFTSSQSSRAHYNPTIFFTSANKNLTQFIKVLLVKLSDMLHSSNFVRLFRQSFMLYGSANVWWRKIEQISHQKLLASKISENSCLFALLIVQVGITDVPHVYIAHMSMNKVVEPMMH